MRGRWALAGAAWMVAASLTTAAAVAAVNSLGEGIFGEADRPLRQSEVTSRLSASPDVQPTQAPSAAVSPGSSPSGAVTVPPAVPRVLGTDGGTIVATCAGNLVTLLSWSPRQGYQADHVVRGPALLASLRFKARSGGGDVRAQVSCVNGEPRVAIVDED